MADLQQQFEAFESTIRIDRKLEKAILVEKRERIFKRLSQGLAKFRREGTTIPGYRHRNQGSYAMDTGIKPLDEDYDLDVALIFDFGDGGRPAPTVVKRWVYEAVEGHTTSVRWREPCVTVFYVKNEEPQYHVDLAVYAEDSTGVYLARGRENAQPADRSWERADPEALIEKIRTRFEDSDERAQFRRCIRYLKRWKDHKFPSQGNEAPRGIALTACAHRWLSPVFDRHPDHGVQPRPNDGVALRKLVERMLRHFDGQGRFVCALPVPPKNDLFADMSTRQLEVFRAKLEDLGSGLLTSERDADPHSAAASLVKSFGSDFPVPDKPSTARKRDAGFVSSSHSG